MVQAVFSMWSGTSEDALSGYVESPYYLVDVCVLIHLCAASSQENGSSTWLRCL